MTNPERNRERRNDYILPRMTQLGMISQAQADAAANEPMHAKPHERPVEVYAPYVAEMVDLIHSRGAMVRLHCHGKIGKVLDMIAETGADGLDPCEAPPGAPLSRPLRSGR